MFRDRMVDYYGMEWSLQWSPVTKEAPVERQRKIEVISQPVALGTPAEGLGLGQPLDGHWTALFQGVKWFMTGWDPPTLREI